MKYYIIFATDNDGVLEKRLAVREQHLVRLKELQEQGRLLVAGPSPKFDDQDPKVTGFAGSCIIAQFTSLEQAQAWAQEDPYVAAGVYAKVEIRPYTVVFEK
ncbi:YciI family protein [Psittacicella hinzii]|uniref:YciI family protein n=1 Tax=Psittacicella hinzii TaxID=2028575 RepID=UPI0036084028